MSFDALITADFKTPLWLHQMKEFEVSADLPARALLWQMRTGKTKFTLDTAAHLFRAGKINCGLVFAPNGVHANWLEREAPKHLWESVSGDVVTLAWRTRVAGLKGGNRLSKADKAAWEDAYRQWWADYEYALKHARYCLLAFNNESVTRPDIRKALARLATRRQCLGVWDESSDYRTPGASRTLMLRALARRLPYRRILDGTPITNSPLHAFAQFELLEKGALGFERFDAFKDRYAEYEDAFGAGGRRYPRLKAYRNLDELRGRIAPLASVVLRADCADLPDLVPRRREVPLSDEQARVYREVESQLKIEIARGEIASLKAQTVKLQKLQQVCSGFLIDEHRKVHAIRGPNPRLDALSEEVYLARGKVIVWCQFHEEMDQAAARLRADGWRVMEYHGRTSDADKAAVRAEFPAAEGKIALVGHPQSGGRGIELPADTIIWYSHTFNGIHRAQADERATVMGGRNVNVVDFVAGGVDSYILDSVAKGMDIADDVAGRGLQAILESNPLQRSES